MTLYGWIQGILGGVFLWTKLANYIVYLEPKYFSFIKIKQVGT